MSDCRDTGFWRAYLDAELSVEQRHQGAAHLEGCQSCRELVDRLKTNRDFVGRAIGMMDMGAPAGGGDVGSAAMRGRRRAAAKRTRMAAALAAAILVALLALMPLVSVARNTMQDFWPDRPTAVPTAGGGGVPSKGQPGHEETRQTSAGTVTIITGHVIKDQKRIPAEVLSHRKPKDPEILPGGYKLITRFGTTASALILDLDEKVLDGAPLKEAQIRKDYFGSVRTIYALVGSSDPDDALVLDEGRVPAISVTEGLDVQRVKKRVGHLLPADVGAQLISNDWKNALTVPLDPHDGQGESVTVAGGKPGILLFKKSGAGGGSRVLIWTYKKRVYSLTVTAGSPLTRTELLNIAASVR